MEDDKNSGRRREGKRVKGVRQRPVTKNEKKGRC